MDRRTFLRAVGATAGVTAAGRAGPALAGTRAAKTSTPLLSVPAKESPLDTIVIMMMENRSFDHYFGWLPGDERYMEAGRSHHGGGFSVNATNQLSFVDPHGQRLHTHHLNGQSLIGDPTRGCGHPDPGHGWDEGRAQRDHGFVAKGSGNDIFALGYFEAEDLPTYDPLVRAFTTFDAYHAAIMSSTYPNRLYLMSAQTDGQKDPPLPLTEGGFHWPCIFDKLRAAGVSAANYCVDLPQSLFFGVPNIPLVRSVADFLVDAAAGTLPQVSFVDPGFQSGYRTDDHPLGDHRLAQAFIATVTRAFLASPQYRRGALIITYDEWGGFFDSVRPPVVPDDRASHVDENNFGQVGFRVPTLLISPFARPGYVDHRYYDHTSVLRLLEWRFLGAPAEGPGGRGWWLTTRDRMAHNLGASLLADLDSEARLDPTTMVPDLSLPCAGYWYQDTPGLDQVGQALFPRPRGNDQAHQVGEYGVEGIHPFEQAAQDGYFERLGYKVRPSMTLAELTS